MVVALNHPVVSYKYSRGKGVKGGSQSHTALSCLQKPTKKTGLHADVLAMPSKE